MPTYTYKCQRCHIGFTIQQYMSDAPLTYCQRCGGTIYRVIQPVYVSYRGPGFYSTDNPKGRSAVPDTASEGVHESSTDD